MGNVVAKDDKRPTVLDREAGANITDLSKFFNVKPYLSPHSDLVALMVLEHQTKMHNIMTRAGYEVRSALQLDAEMKKMLGEKGSALGDSAQRRVDRAAEILARYLLFTDEARIDQPGQLELPPSPRSSPPSARETRKVEACAISTSRRDFSSTRLAI